MFENFKKGFGTVIGVTAGMVTVKVVTTILGAYNKAVELKKAEEKKNG